MPTAADLASQFSSSNLSRARVRAFVDHISKVEADAGISVKKGLINGIPPFETIPGVEFDVPRSKINKVLDMLLSNPRVNPNVIIDGIPAEQFLRVRVLNR